MAYLALARKWRPKAFSEVVGQSHVVKALSNALNSGRVHHAFLFTGTRGIGKTTLARIFAKSLNCEEGMSAEPCQKCSTCISIDEGRYIDLIEVDAASRTKVDETRELLENVQYAPTSGKYKVYLIDEVHMLSGHSFNAFLKTLEEPPEHVKFLFATTDPQKLPVTVLSRCLQFNLRAMRPEQIENQLVKILSSEEIEFDQTALHTMAKAADGSMRDGLSLLDQAIVQGAGTVSADDVESMLGTIKAEHSNALLAALASQSADQIMKVVADMADHAVDFSAALDELLMQLYNVSLAQIAPNSFNAKELDSSIIADLSKNIKPETIQLYYQIGLIGKRDIALAPSLRVGFEMALLRMLAFEPNNSGGNVSGQSTKSKPIENTSSAPQTASSPPIETKPEVPTQENEGHTIEQVVSAPQQQSTPVQAQAKAAEVQVSSAPVPEIIQEAQPEPKATNNSQSSAIAVTLAGNNEWGELVEQCNLQGLSKQLAMHCACEKLSDDLIQLSLSVKSQHLFKPERLADIQTEVQLISQAKTIVELEVVESDKETPAACLERLGFEELEQTKQNLQNDPGVQALMSEFGATINEQSIKPINY